jgi:hypothetical protein
MGHSTLGCPGFDNIRNPDPGHRAGMTLHLSWMLGTQSIMEHSTEAKCPQRSGSGMTGLENAMSNTATLSGVGHLRLMPKRRTKCSYFQTGTAQLEN